MPSCSWTSSPYTGFSGNQGHGVPLVHEEHRSCSLLHDGTVAEVMEEEEDACCIPRGDPAVLSKTQLLRRVCKPPVKGCKGNLVPIPFPPRKDACWGELPC